MNEMTASQDENDTAPKMKTTPKFQAGAICRVKDLKNRAELNGEEIFVREFDSNGGRYVCDRRISEAAEERTALKLKEANLEFILGKAKYTLEELQQWMDECPSGKRLCLPRGRWHDVEQSEPKKKLHIRKPIVICGLGNDDHNGTVWNFLVEFDCQEKRTKLEWHDFRINGAVEIKGTSLDEALLKRVVISARPDGEDALHLNGTTSQRDKKKKPKNYRPDRVLLDQCKIFGGGDGIHVNCPHCTVKNCEIRGAGSRGIFVSEDCVIEDSVVQGCGAYGVKTRASLTRMGKNSIQAGPWDNQPWNTNMEDGYLERLLGRRGVHGDDDEDSEEDMYGMGGLGGMMGGGMGGLGGIFGGLGSGMGGMEDLLGGGYGDDDDDMFTHVRFLRPDGDVEMKTMDWLRTNGFDDEFAPGLYGCRSTWESLSEEKQREIRR